MGTGVGLVSRTFINTSNFNRNCHHLQQAIIETDYSDESGPELIVFDQLNQVLLDYY